MTLRQALSAARGILSGHNIENFALECEILLCHALNIDRVQMFLDQDRELTTEQESLFRRLIERRATGEPTAYITGHREFYGIDFFVNSNVLIPRPETESLVEKVIELSGRYDILAIADIGTGSGAIAIALALNLPQVKVYASDVSEPALKVAHENCQRHGVSDRVTLLSGDMLVSLPEPVDLIMANLPYVRESVLTPEGPLGFEPALALNGGTDGLDKIRQLAGELKGKPQLTRHLLLEIGQGQKDSVINLLQEACPGASIETGRDLGGIERVVSLTQVRTNDKLITASAKKLSTNGKQLSANRVR